MINTKFWDDGYITELDPIEKLLFLYLLTNPLTTIAGAYEIKLKRMAFDTGIDKDMCQKILDRFEKDEKVFYRENWIIIKNFIKHQLKNPKVERGIEIELSKAPEEVSRIVYGYSMDRLSHSNPNTNTNPKADNSVHSFEGELIGNYKQTLSSILKNASLLQKEFPHADIEEEASRFCLWYQDKTRDCGQTMSQRMKKFRAWMGKVKPKSQPIPDKLTKKYKVYG